ncbi:hypothetical protein SO078_25880 (plasmid) [Sinorhizobium meliloti]|uniref:hypothetical protein n=1 Tax=Rhizobium meliloti TaxID=382 RepID=UPI002D77400C|nr:hypothetical protein [Sinorhizobium meliloti]WRQ71577.1 hypothetical protein SO078_25880 [Sinorhizobium meliloti]
MDAGAAGSTRSKHHLGCFLSGWDKMLVDAMTVRMTLKPQSLGRVPAGFLGPSAQTRDERSGWLFRFRVEGDATSKRRGGAAIYQCAKDKTP